MRFKEIRQKILKGDFSGLLGFKENNSTVHPTEMATMLASLPEITALNAFATLPSGNQLMVFPYVDILLQKKIIKTAGKTRASLILNELSSDDRMIFFSSLKVSERPDYLVFLNEKNKAAVQDLLGYPDKSIARLINMDFATIGKDLTIGEANEYLRKNHKDTEAANVIYVVDKEGRLIDDILKGTLL